jgi:hypothetical protein
MIHTSFLIPTLHICKFYKLPSDITQFIYYDIINTSAQKIIDKWFSFVSIHNSNLCYIVNIIPIIQVNTSGDRLISYYDLQDKKLNIALSICVKYIKPSISDNNWWSYFLKNGFNGFMFIDNYDDIAQQNISFLNQIYDIFEKSNKPSRLPKNDSYIYDQV